MLGRPSGHTAPPTRPWRAFFLVESATRPVKCCMANPGRVGLSYGAHRKECLEAVRQWPGCETITGIQIIRESTLGGFSVRVTLYGRADKKTADRAIARVQREKRWHFCLIE
jgi:hypothetical protein